MGGTILGFYSNLRELNGQTRETLAGRPTVNITNASIARRMQLMAANLSQALDGLNNERPFPVSPELETGELFMPDGNAVNTVTPKSLQELLLRLAGLPPRPVTAKLSE
jgi:hypothetical protein